MKPLPYIAIEGVGKTKEEVLDSLIAIEPLLVMMGYNKPDEDWNDRFCTNFDGTWKDSTIILNETNSFELEYHNHLNNAPLRFKSTEINKLIKYMITNKFIK